MNENYGAVNKLFVKKLGVSQIVYHWYQDEDKIIQSGIEQNINRFINKVRFNRDDGAFVRISIDGRAEGAEDALRQFGRLIIPLITKNWPIEEEI
jgi:EpsI family protein